MAIQNSLSLNRSLHTEWLFSFFKKLLSEETLSITIICIMGRMDGVGVGIVFIDIVVAYSQYPVNVEPLSWLWKLVDLSTILPKGVISTVTVEK